MSSKHTSTPARALLLCAPAIILWGLFGQGVASASAQTLLDASTLTKYVDALPNPLDNLMQPSGTLNGATYYEVSISQFTQQLHRELPATTVWGYNGSYPGPTLVAQRDELVRVKWTNELVDQNGAPLGHLLPYDTTLHGAGPQFAQSRTVTHLHGAVTDEASDGFPEHWFTGDPNATANAMGGPAGNSLTTTYYNRQRSAALWYHDHSMGITRLNVYAGLAGFYLIRDEQEESLNLPSGDYEVPLVFQDRKFYDDGQLFYPAGPGDLSSPGVGDPLEGLNNPQDFTSDVSEVPHFFGDANLVNGVVWPYMEVEARKYRFRMLNGANARFYNLALEDEAGENVVFHQIGTDGGLFSTRVERTELLFAPSERLDVVVDFSGYSTGDQIFLRNTAPDGTVGLNNTSPANPATTGQVMQFRVIDSTGPDTSSLPDNLSTIVRYDENEAVVTRHLSIVSNTDEFGRTELLLDGKKWTDPVSEIVQLGDLEIWELENFTPDAHPIHLHLEAFQILDRSSRMTGDIPLEDHEMGWEDVVIVNPGEKVRIMVKFDQFSGTFVWHGHMLEHEDLEMMRPFQVVPEPSTGFLLLIAAVFGMAWTRRRR